jgi:pimeloyl-ACP methyl ester carboxylesterase
MGVAQKPLSMKSFTATSGSPAWNHIRSWYLVSSNDQMIPPQAEEMTANRMDATVRTVAASHASMISHPQEVADIIVEAAEAKVAAVAAVK